MSEWIDMSRSFCIRLLKSGLWNELRAWITNLVTGEDLSGLVKKILIFAAVAAVLGFAVDQIVYWTRADHSHWMLKPWKLFRGKKEMTREEEPYGKD